jgi:hypothetical protein
MCQLGLMQETPSAMFRVRPRLLKALHSFGLLLAMLATGCVLLHATQKIDWLDCAYWCPPRRRLRVCWFAGTCRVAGLRICLCACMHCWRAPHTGSA